jgi:outer membrane protein OmpA-like peptidoglycan-associated protein
MRSLVTTRTVLALLTFTLSLASTAPAQEVNVLALGAGTLPVVEPPSYGGWPAANLLDDSGSSGFACEDGHVAGNVFVFELVAPATISAFEFDTAGIDGDNRGARDVTVEVSATSKDAGFRQVLKATLADRRDGQRFPAQTSAEGTWVRLTIANNHGDEQWTELMGFRGYGTQHPARPIADLSGTYHTDYNDFHLRQQGTALTGCYEYNEGLFDGTVEGRVMKLTWRETGNGSGPAVLVFAPDGASFRGYWWRDTDHGRAPNGTWDGTRASATVGSCPHWSGSVSGELHRGLAASGRVRLYGILFDTDSAKIRAESLPTLDEVVKVLASEPSWKLTVEGHTDSTGAAAHNQTLSEQRAASVRDYLVGKGVSGDRLTAVGFGQTKPVADNATELGRAQNRRVELVRN